jgi:hypothetical protein
MFCAFLLGGILAAGSVRAQFVSLSRCHAAYPCAIPFGLQYHPDPLVAGQYGQPGQTAVSGRIELKFPLKVEIDKPIDQKALDAELRKSLEVQKRGADEKTIEPARAPEKPEKNPPPNLEER